MVGSYPSSRIQHRIGVRSGLTLIEIMIALTMTLIVLGAMMIAFQYASKEISRGRAVIEMSNQLRSVQELIRNDLNGLTVDPRPHTQTASAEGYFELIEGPSRDQLNAVTVTDNYLGDVDDILAFTSRSASRPFRGRLQNAGTVPAGVPVLSNSVGQAYIQESSVSEIVWSTDWADRDTDSLVDYDETVSVLRRTLLIRPDLGFVSIPELPGPAENILAAQQFFATNDISCRWIDSDGNGIRDLIVANTLADLAKRENRYAHNSVVFPHVIGRPHLSADPTFGFRMADIDAAAVLTLTGNDVVLTDNCSFDFKVYSPNSGICEVSNLILDPNDPGFDEASATLPVFAVGGYVDLNHGTDPITSLANGSTGWFSATPHLKSQLFAPDMVYDTWSPHYEHDGVNQDGDLLADEGTNGVNNGGGGAGVDDNDERETMPPYAQPLRGIKLSIRMVEKNTKQVRQTSVIHSFVPE